VTIRHVSLLTFAVDADLAPFETALATLPDILPIRNYRVGRDLGINDGNATFAVVADFDTQADYLQYRDNPEHQRILREIAGPMLVARTVVQYEFTE
jgi:hypothetical protein